MNNMGKDIAKAVEIIKNSGVVAFPTETVYGLGANAYDTTACKQIYALKTRPSNNPLIVHAFNMNMIEGLVFINHYAEILAKNFWPGPLSMVLPRKSSQISPIVSAGLNTLAVRIPDNDIALEFIKTCGCPIAAPSANISGYISPTSRAHVTSAFPNIYCLEGERSVYGLESTIIDLSSPKPTLLRSGFITKEALENCLNMPVESYAGADILAPGMSYKHYAPSVKLRLDANSLAPNELGLDFNNQLRGASYDLSTNGNMAEAAANLYHYLRLLDVQAAREHKTIAVAALPHKGIAIAINDRLKRAAV